MNIPIQQFAHNILTCCVLDEIRAHLTHTIHEEPASYRTWLQFEATLKARFSINEIDAVTLRFILIPLRLFAYRQGFHLKSSNEQAVICSSTFPSLRFLIAAIAQSSFLFNLWYNDTRKNYGDVEFTPATIFLTAPPFLTMFYNIIIPLFIQAATNLPPTFPIINRQEFEEQTQRYEDLRV